jgi:hypothetical protein
MLCINIKLYSNSIEVGLQVPASKNLKGINVGKTWKIQEGFIWKSKTFSKLGPNYELRMFYYALTTDCSI